MPRAGYEFSIGECQLIASFGHHLHYPIRVFPIGFQLSLVLDSISFIVSEDLITDLELGVVYSSFVVFSHFFLVPGFFDRHLIVPLY